MCCVVRHSTALFPCPAGMTPPSTSPEIQSRQAPTVAGSGYTPLPLRRVEDIFQAAPDSFVSIMSVDEPAAIPGASHPDSGALIAAASFESPTPTPKRI